MFPTNDNEVSCLGFDVAQLPKIKKAIEEKKVQWLYAESCVGGFKFENDYYEIQEICETVIQVTKLTAQQEHSYYLKELTTLVKLGIGDSEHAQDLRSKMKETRKRLTTQEQK
jgi:hypothetical protein